MPVHKINNVTAGALVAIVATEDPAFRVGNVHRVVDVYKPGKKAGERSIDLQPVWIDPPQGDEKPKCVQTVRIPSTELKRSMIVSEAFGGRVILQRNDK